jgi:hypothetical protein
MRKSALGARFPVVVQFEIHRAGNPFRPVGNCWGMAKKRTKADKAQRQADELETKLDRHPVQVPKKKTTHKDVDQAAARTVP